MNADGAEQAAVDQETPWRQPSAEQRRDILASAKTIAVVGASDNPSRASFGVIRYLLAAADYRLLLVNPRLTEMLGMPVYPALSALGVVPDIVDVFRRRDDLPQVLDECIAVGARTLWLQLGLDDVDIARRAQRSGITVVMDRCLKIDHAEFFRGQPADRS